MKKEELNNLLKQANLTRKELSVLLECSPQTINNWGSTQNVPYWVKSWLENYIAKQKHEQMLNILKDSGVCE